MTPSETDPGASEPHDIAYREDGRIPIGIAVVWALFGVWAVWYSARYAWPDFVAWLREVSAS